MKSTILDLWNNNKQLPLWVQDDSGYKFYIAGIAPNKIAVGWGYNGMDAAFGALSKEWFVCADLPEVQC